jgi:hypothetical protein
VILNAVVHILTGIMTGLVGLLPSGAGMSALDLAPAFGIMGTLDAWLPIHEVVTAAAVCIALLGAVFGFALFRQAWRFVPIIGGG